MESEAPLLAAQYFRPPFPERHRWREDLQDMRRAGLSAAYFWVCWGWVEPEPGRFEFDDYDELIELADEAGLRVVLNTIAEIQPFWIHREFPDSRLVDHRGNEVISVPRRECQVGLAPGGCIDHPGVVARLRGFLDRVGNRYASADALIAWDLWNETRWAVHSEGQVCYCDHTIAAFREWLRERHGSLEDLNRAWRRRFSSWDDVEPGRHIGASYTDHMEYQAFLTERAARHMRLRHETIRAADPERLIVAHAMSPAPLGTRVEHEQALSRGNDWEFTDFLDGFGSSFFPAWVQNGGAEFGARLETSRAAAQDKVFWLGELQGASGRSGFGAFPSVTAEDQQRWLWRGYSRGAKAVSFWCWRDEVFGRESSGFGISGSDGHAGDRIRALVGAREILDRNREALAAYRPDPARIGVVFEPAAYQMDWAQFGPEHVQSKGSLLGYLYAFERTQLPYEVIESHHRAALPGCSLLVMPWPLIVDPELAAEVLEWVKAGGTLLVESELDAYDSLGFYRYADERPFAAALGLRSEGRRTLAAPELPYELGSLSGALPLTEWIEPLTLAEGESLAGAGEGSDLLLRRRLGEGTVIAVGGLPGLGYHDGERGRPDGFESFVRRLAEDAAALPGVSCDVDDGDQVTLRTGAAGGRRLLFVTDEQPRRELTLTLATSLSPPLREAEVELLAGESIEVRPGDRANIIVLRSDEYGRAIVSWGA